MEWNASPADHLTTTTTAMARVRNFPSGAERVARSSVLLLLLPDVARLWKYSFTRFESFESLLKQFCLSFDVQIRSHLIEKCGQ